MQLKFSENNVKQTCNWSLYISSNCKAN